MNGLDHLRGLKRRRAGSGDGDLRFFDTPTVLSKFGTT